MERAPRLSQVPSLKPLAAELRGTVLGQIVGDEFGHAQDAQLQLKSTLMHLLCLPKPGPHFGM